MGSYIFKIIGYKEVEFIAQHVVLKLKYSLPKAIGYTLKAVNHERNI